MRKVSSVLTVLALAGTMALAQGNSGNANGMQHGNKAERGERAERHPEIRKAMRQLEAAKDSLQHAAHDFGGHREAAIKSIDEALNQLNQALAYDKK
jgi:hypothetical protein